SCLRAACWFSFVRSVPDDERQPDAAGRSPCIVDPPSGHFGRPGGPTKPDDVEARAAVPRGVVREDMRRLPRLVFLTADAPGAERERLTRRPANQIALARYSHEPGGAKSRAVGMEERSKRSGPITGESGSPSGTLGPQ